MTCIIIIKLYLCRLFTGNNFNRFTLKLSALTYFLFIAGFTTGMVLFSTAQSFEINNGDTINVVDAGNLKQGHWIVFNKIKKLPGYTDEQIVEEGNYTDGKKTGIWKKLYPNGKTESEITYTNNRPDGPAKMYYENGNLKEEGLWKINKWAGEYKFYYENGQLYQNFNFSQLGKREGAQKYFHENGQLMIEGEWANGKESGVIKEYYESGELKAERAFADGVMDAGKSKEFERKEPPPPPPPPPPPSQMVKVEKDEQPNLGIFDGNGYHKLYNKNKQISKDGYFKSGKLIDGKWYKYDENGIIQSVAVYKNGVYVGDAPLEKEQ
ncbi:MAG: hypothetical protein HYY40_12950 [Bacteroidetes bacterium]|nr:hypothetical protein [Bacteroidota bacterium]